MSEAEPEFHCSICDSTTHDALGHSLSNELNDRVDRLRDALGMPRRSSAQQAYETLFGGAPQGEPLGSRDVRVIRTSRVASIRVGRSALHVTDPELLQVFRASGSFLAHMTDLLDYEYGIVPEGCEVEEIGDEAFASLREALDAADAQERTTGKRPTLVRRLPASEWKEF